MIADFARSVVSSYLMPRRTLRVVLSRGLGPQDVALLLLLGYVIAEILSILVPGARPENGSGVSRHVLGLASAFASLFLFAWPIYGIGRMFGGTGDLLQTCVMWCWFSLVMSFVSVPALPAMLEVFATLQKGPPSEETAQALQGSMAVIFIMAAIWFWMLGNFVTELHGFRSVIATTACMFGIMLFVALFFMVMAGG